MESILVLLMCGNLKMLGSSRLMACIRVVAAQGILLGTLPLLMHHSTLEVRIVFIILATIVLKGLVFPYLLYRALREVDVRREVEPLVSFNLSLLVGVLALGISLWLSTRLPLPFQVESTLVVPAAFYTIFTGLFLIISRRKALTQVLGYLVLENGIYIFGLTLTQEKSLIFELGVLLDVFFAVLVMGIVIFRINREFEHIDVDRLSTLKD